MKLEKMRKMDNKGFSIVELLIAVAIASIVGVAVFGFMRVGARTFSFNSADVNLQSESQLAFNQMQDLVIDTAVGIQYFAKNGDTFDSSSLAEVADDSEIAVTSDKLLRLYNTDCVYDIWWDRDECKLYYNEWTAHIDTSTGEVVLDNSVPDKVDSALMSEFIKDFSVDLSRLVSSRVVRVDFTYEKGDRVQAYSHNITLRNQIVSGNKIEEHIRDAYTISENILPQSVRGKDIIYAEPGDSVDLKTVVDDAVGGTGLTGYHVFDDIVSGNQIDDKETLHYGFASASGHKSGYTKIDYNTGVLNIHPTETVGEFQVLVYCQSNNSIAKVVRVRVVRTMSLSVNFIPGDEKADELNNGATGDDIYADDLKAGEKFSLKAVPSISWTVGGTPADELSPSDRTNLQTIENNINTGIYFKGLVGYPELFKVTATSNLNCGLNPCEFEIANNLTFGVGEADYYTTEIKARAICGYSESKSRDVHKDWEGAVYKKKADFTITYKNNIQRGSPQYIYKTTNTFTCTDDSKDNTGGFWAHHVQLLEVVAIERDYTKPTDDCDYTPRTMDREEYIRNFEVKSGSEGNTITWKCPVEWRLDCEYEFTFTMHIAHAKSQADATAGIYVLPYGGYTKADYEYTSNTTPPVVFHRFSLSYRGKENYNNINIKEIAKEPIDSENYVDQGNYVTYYARNFQEYSPRGTKRLGYYQQLDNVKVNKYNNYNAFPRRGNSNEVYLDTSSNQKYGWDGGKYYPCAQYETKAELPGDGEAGCIYTTKIGYQRVHGIQPEEHNTKDEFPSRGSKFNKVYIDKETGKKYAWDGQQYYECEYASKEVFPYKSEDGTILKDYLYVIAGGSDFYNLEAYRITDTGEYYRFTSSWGEDPIILPITLNNEFTYRTDVWAALLEKKNEINSVGKWKTYKPVYGSDGSYSWEEYTSRDIITDYNMDQNDIPKKKIMFKYFTSQNEGGYLNMNLYKDYINKNIPARLRICPFISWQNRDYVIDYNYVECVFWNIKIPYKSLLGELYKATGWGSSYDISYFPGPDEPNFPGTKSTATRWLFAGYGDQAGYITSTADDGGKFYELRYTLTEVSNYNAPSTWKLKLMYESDGHEYKDLASFTYNTKTKMWDLIIE